MEVYLYDKGNEKHVLLKDKYEKNCKFCGRVFQANRPEKLYCSVTCQQESAKAKHYIPTEPIEKYCVVCGKKFKTVTFNKLTCSRTCSRKRKRLMATLNKQKYENLKAEKPKRVVKTFDDRIAEADACGLSYGNYVLQTTRFGKSFEELKAQYEARQNFY